MTDFGTCQFYVSIEQPECGDPGVAKVTVQGRAAKARVVLCEKHKAVHDETFARIRNERKHSA